MLTPLRVLLLFLTLIGFGGTVAWSQLSFEHDRVEHMATADEESFEGRFPFENTGETTVTVKNVRSTCGCTVPELEKKVYEPGESGVVRAVFTYGQRTGLQHKAITVSTDKGVHRLALVVNIPPKWTVEPRSIVSWKAADGEASSQEIVIRFDSIKPRSVALQGYPEDLFAVETGWDEQANVFTLQVTPRGLDQKGIHRAYVQVARDEGKTETIPIYLRIQ